MLQVSLSVHSAWKGNDCVQQSMHVQQPNFPSMGLCQIACACLSGLKLQNAILHVRTANFSLEVRIHYVQWRCFPTNLITCS